MEIRVEETKKCLKVEKIAKKELIGKLLIFFLILLYTCIRLYINKEKTAIITFIFAFPIFLCIVFYFISDYPYEVFIIKNGKIIRYVSLFYRYLKWCKAFNFLEIHSIDDLKNIYFKNTTEILVSKVLKRSESPYHKIHIKFKDKSYKGFGIKLKDKDAKEIVLIINKFLEKYKKEVKIKIRYLQKKKKQII